jgi:hypothetical protein
LTDVLFPGSGLISELENASNPLRSIGESEAGQRRRDVAGSAMSATRYRGEDSFYGEYRSAEGMPAYRDWQFRAGIFVGEILFT